MPELKVIINPVAGKGAGLRHQDQVRDLLNQNRLDFDLVQTEGPLHAIGLARDASLAGYKAVVAVGGDGTSNEVINGLMQAKKKGGGAALGVIGIGTGNDFAYGVGVPEDMQAACQCLAKDQRRWIDVAFVKGGNWSEVGRYAGNGIGVGFDVIATLQVKRIKWITGTPAFVLAALKTLFLHFAAPLISMEADGKSITERWVMMSMMNGRRLGGGFRIAPQALLDDGLFDLTLARQTSRLTMLRLMGMYMQGTQHTHPAVRTMRAKRIAIRAEGGLASHADGEIFMTDGKCLDLEMVPRQIEVISQRQESS